MGAHSWNFSEQLGYFQRNWIIEILDFFQNTTSRIRIVFETEGSILKRQMKIMRNPLTEKGADGIQLMKPASPINIRLQAAGNPRKNSELSWSPRLNPTKLLRISRRHPRQMQRTIKQSPSLLNFLSLIFLSPGFP